MLELFGIKTKDGIFLANKTDIVRDYGSYSSSLKQYEINKENPEETFDKSWIKIKEEPKIITKIIRGRAVNYRYEIKDESLVNDKIPKVIPRDDACKYDEDDGWVWKQEYGHLCSLYELKNDTEPDTKEEVPFTYKEILQIDEIKAPVTLDWDFYRSEWTHEGTTKATTNTLEYRVLDKIAFPKIYYQSNCPVRLRSKVLYRMLRFHIKNNIDNKISYISSDYDFCFAVKKRIKLFEPKITKEEILKQNGRSYKAPKFVTKKYEYAGDYIVFSMGHKEKPWQDYPVLPDIDANNIEELKEKVDKILAAIIDEINSEVTICPHCEGTGIINKSRNTVDIYSLINGL